MANPTQPAPQSGQPQQQPKPQPQPQPQQPPQMPQPVQQPSPQPPPAQGLREHVVTAGETIDTIAKKYGIKPYDLRYANQLWNRALNLGEKLKIPPPRAQKTGK